MFGSNNTKNRPAASDPQAADPRHALMGVSEKQIGELRVAPPPDDNTAAAPAPIAAPTAPPLNDIMSTVASQPLPPVEPPAPTNAAAKDLNNVNLESAYINEVEPSKPNNVGIITDGQPSAASLMTNANEGDLLNIKQQALQSLAPLVDELEQTPEEKFRTTMMLIQASDNADLIKEAYDAANAIKDEKARAQALLDVVNEINYFTQHAEASAEPNSNLS